MVRFIYTKNELPDLTSDTREDAQNFELTVEQKETLWHLLNGNPSRYLTINRMLDAMFKQENHRIVQELSKYGTE